MHESSLIVALQNPPKVDDLEKISDVLSVEKVDEYRFKINYEPGQSPAESIATTAVQQQWRLTELIPEKRSLEQIFVDITTSETSEQADTASGEDQAA